MSYKRIEEKDRLVEKRKIADEAEDAKMEMLEEIIGITRAHMGSSRDDQTGGATALLDEAKSY